MEVGLGGWGPELGFVDLPAQFRQMHHPFEECQFGVSEHFLCQITMEPNFLLLQGAAQLTGLTRSPELFERLEVVEQERLPLHDRFLHPAAW